MRAFWPLPSSLSFSCCARVRNLFRRRQEFVSKKSPKSQASMTGRGHACAVFLLLQGNDMTRQTIAILTAALLLVGCGGTKVLKEPQPLVIGEPLTTAGDERLAVDLDWVIVRDGAGTWARNADWDEYLIRVHNKSGTPVEVTSVVLVDSRHTSHDTVGNRKQLVKASRAAARRYKDAGIEVRAGSGGATLVAVGGASAIAGTTAGVAAVYGSNAAMAASAGAMLIAPAVVTGGIVRGVNNSRVNDEIERRQTALPQLIEPDGTAVLNLFFPITPSPISIELIYRDGAGQYGLVIDTAESLDGLHLPTDAEAK